MLKEERLNYIVNEVKIRNRVQLLDIAQKLSVSEDTVRRDSVMNSKELPLFF
jgi:DeoR/GlpR family transcriptional regulator of sugar metabolism